MAATQTETQARRVEAVRRQLELVSSSRLLLRLGDVKLYDDRVTMPEGECALSPHVRASVETARSLRARRPRRRPLRPEQVRDADELYLLVETPSCRSVSPIPRRNRRAAWHFAARIVAAGQAGGAVVESRRAVVRRLEAELDRLTGGTSPS